MPSVDIVVRSKIEKTPRVMQISGMFEVPPREEETLSWRADVPIEDRPWNVGLIVGPSGSGKTLCARRLFGEDKLVYEPTWSHASVIDDFPDVGIHAIAETCASVGFNTIPAWLRPYSVLSNGEKFRANLARVLLEQADPIVVDEFTSVVDRQVAQIASHAVQKYVRRNGRRFVAVSCHYDIVDWLQPDWVFEPVGNRFVWRSLQGRPKFNVSICRVAYATWGLFAPFHYMSSDLHKAATCFGLFVGDRIASFAGILHMPHPKAKNIKRVSRLVTLPDWQGLGLAFVLTDALGAAYKATGFRLHDYPAHPLFVKSFQRNLNWRQLKGLNEFCSRSRSRSLRRASMSFSNARSCATFEYVGETMTKDAASMLLSGVREDGAKWSEVSGAR